MVIGGVVISVHPDDRREAEIALTRVDGLSVYGGDEKGHIIGVLKRSNSESIRDGIRAIEGIDTVRRVNLAYINSENNAEIPDNQEVSR